MICSYDEWKYYLKQDRIARGIPTNIKRPRFGRDVVWRWQILFRKLEYITNCKPARGIWNLYRLILLVCFRYKSVKLGFTIPINTIEEGLYIPHYGTIVIHGNAHIGKNCRLMEGTNIGDSSGGVPNIGNNCFICTGAKIIGAVNIADDVIIGANAVVNKSVVDSGVTVAGIPARIVSKKSSRDYLNPRLFNEL